jgi:hypothetical protein
MPGNHINVVYTPGPSRSRKHALAASVGAQNPSAPKVSGQLTDLLLAGARRNASRYRGMFG